MEQETDSLYLAVNKARGLTLDAVGQIMELTGLPPYLMDCILSGVLADIRQKEIYDMGLIKAKDTKPSEPLKEAKEETDGEH